MSLLSMIPDALDYGVRIVATASAVAAVIPRQNKNAATINMVYKVLDILACNWGRARNKS